ncbi:uncharacterized protein LOC142333881 [Lycorma delicatula]|uniref:uncharacterized protein LOC142333881 n=1 Tax=Lycorma delicatula TaxID=130591 RepID=UPI003F51059B
MALISSIATSFIVFILLLILFNSLYNNKKEEKIKNKNVDESINLMKNLEEKFCNNYLHVTAMQNEKLLKNQCSSVYNLFVLLKNQCFYVSKNINIFNKNYMLEDKPKIISSNKTISFDQNENDVIKNKTYINKIETMNIKQNHEILELMNRDVNEELDIDDDDNEEEEASEIGIEVNNVEEADDKIVNREIINNNTSLAYLFVCLLLVLSTIVSLIEFYQERKRKKKSDDNQDFNPPDNYGGSRRISIVDLTVSRHARKESQKESNINNTGSGRTHPPLIRRSSFPAQIPEVIKGRARLTTQRQQTWSPSGSFSTSSSSSRRVSIDTTAEEDFSQDRRRVRIIRRH